MGGGGRLRDARYDGNRWTFLPQRRDHWYEKITIVGRETLLTLKGLNLPGKDDQRPLARRERGRWVPLTAPIRLADERVESLVGDGQGGLWLLTGGSDFEGTLRHWSRGRWTTARQAPPIGRRRATLHALAQVPGTSSVWGVGRVGLDTGAGGEPFIETTAPPPAQAHPSSRD